MRIKGIIYLLINNNEVKSFRKKKILCPILIKKRIELIQKSFFLLKQYAIEHHKKKLKKIDADNYYKFQLQRAFILQLFSKTKKNITNNRFFFLFFVREIYVEQKRNLIYSSLKK